jgi:hypothetical protein
MGLFSSIGKAVSSVASAAKSAGIVVAESTGIAKLWGDTGKPTVAPSVAKIPIVGGVAKALVEHPFLTAAVVAAPLTTVGKTVIKTIASAALKVASNNPIKTGIASAIAIPAIVGTIVRSPNQAINTVANAPSNIAQFEKDIYTVAKEPTIENLLNIPKNSPIISTGLGILGAVAVTKAVSLPLALAANNILDDKSEATKLPVAPESPSLVPEQTKGALPAAASISEVPITPETKPLIATAGSGTTTKRRKRAAIKQTIPSMRQNLNVFIQNRNSHIVERVINSRILA